MFFWSNKTLTWQLPALLCFDMAFFMCCMLTDLLTWTHHNPHYVALRTLTLRRSYFKKSLKNLNMQSIFCTLVTLEYSGSFYQESKDHHYICNPPHWTHISIVSRKWNAQNGFLAPLPFFCLQYHNCSHCNLWISSLLWFIIGFTARLPACIPVGCPATKPQNRNTWCASHVTLD